MDLLERLMTVAYEADQLTLLSEPRARAHDPETSHDAAEKVARGHQARLLRVERIVADAGAWGATADEIHAATRLEDGNTRARSTWHGAVSAAAKAGFIVPRSDGARRLSIFGTVMTVYVTPQHQRGSSDG